MRKHIHKIWHFLLLLIPFSVFADSSTGDGSLGNFIHAFTPSTYSANDLSMYYLSQIFGSVGGVLSGNNGQLLGRIFETFNNGLLVIAGLFLTYTVFKAVIDTAESGELMGGKGGKGKPAWIAFRTALGVGCLIPSKATGYSLIQVFFMWAVVQGVGFADMVWGRAIDYLANEGGAVYVTRPITLDNQTPVVPTAGEIMQSQICTYRLGNTINATNQATAQADTTATTAAVQSDVVGYSFTQDKDTNGNVVSETLNFGKKTDQTGINSSGESVVMYGNDCGSYQIFPSSDNTASSADNTLLYKELALTQVVLDTAQTAEKIASLSTTDQLDDTISTQSVNALTSAVADYTNIITPALDKEGEGASDKVKEALETAKDQGWIAAGSYYRKLAAVNNKIDADMNKYMPTQGSVPFPAMASGELQGDDFVQTAINKVEDPNDPNNANDYNALTVTQLQTLQNQKNTLDQAPIDPARIKQITSQFGVASGISAGLMIVPPVGMVMTALNQGFKSIVSEWASAMNHGPDDPTDPILRIQKLGNKIVTIVTIVWAASVVIVFALAVGMSICTASSGVGETIISTMIMFAPIFLMIILTLFAIGLVMSVYIPLIPFLVYFFASAGWFVLILECMIAAPLVALGITHPEGHDLLGRAEQAIMMLLNVFLRPAMLLVGFLAAMIMARVSVNMLDTLFRITTDSIDISDYNIFSTIALLIAYTLIVMYIIQYVFETCIAKVPAFVSQWIGIHGHPDETGGGMEAAKGGVHSAGSGISDAGSRIGQGEGEWARGFKGKKQGKDLKINPPKS